MTGMLYENIEAIIVAGAADRIVEELFQWPHLRQSISRATEDFSPTGETCSNYSMALGCILFLVLYLTILIQAVPLLDMSASFADRMTAISAVQHGVVNGFQIFIFDWAQRLGVFFTNDTDIIYEKAFGESIEVPWENFNQQMRT